jgi:hypothetical protein
MDRLAKFLTKKGITLLSIFKNDEKHFLNKGAMPMKEELRNVSFTKKEINHFFAHFEGYNYYYITEMEEVFQNQAVLDYIHQLKSLPRESYSYKEKNKEDNHSSYSIYTFKSLMTDNEDYQKMIKVMSDGQKILSEKYSLIESLKNAQINKSVLKEIKAYIECKDKGE